MDEKQGIQTENWSCQNCGGTLKWNIKKQRFECEACRTPGKINAAKKSVKEHNYSDFKKLMQGEMAFPEETIISCSTCGAKVAFKKSETAKVCPMCGSTQIDAEKQLNGVAPDGIIPFKVDKEDAQANFHKWVKSRWFAPNKLKQAYQQGRLDGIYIPYWTFDAEVEGNYKGQGGKEYTVKNKKGETETKVNWHRVNGTVTDSFDDLAVCASENKVTQVIEEVLPFSTQKKSVPYASAFLSGFGAERYAVPADKAVGTAKKIMKQKMKDNARSDIITKGYDRANVEDIEMIYNQLKYKHVLLPVWTSAFSYGGKQYLYLINGETGKVGGNRPYSAVKIVIAVLVALAVLFGGFMLFSDDSEAAAVSQYEAAHVVHEVVLTEDDSI